MMPPAGHFKLSSNPSNKAKNLRKAIGPELCKVPGQWLFFPYLLFFVNRRIFLHQAFDALFRKSDLQLNFFASAFH